MAKLRCIDHRRGVYMLRKELFEKLEMIVRCLKDNSQPFGGIQLIFSGDFYQLRPVTQSYATNESLYCFASPMWASCVDPPCFSFLDLFRQQRTISAVAGFLNVANKPRNPCADSDSFPLLSNLSNTSGCEMLATLRISHGLSSCLAFFAWARHDPWWPILLCY